MEYILRGMELCLKVRDDLSEEVSTQVDVVQLKVWRWESSRPREDNVWRIHGKRKHDIFKELKITEYGVRV